MTEKLLLGDSISLVRVKWEMNSKLTSVLPLLCP